MTCPALYPGKAQYTLWGNQKIPGCAIDLRVGKAHDGPPIWAYSSPETQSRLVSRTRSPNCKMILASRMSGQSIQKFEV